MTGSFILDYYLLVFLASCGLFQVIAARIGIRGMLFIKHRPVSFFLGLGLFAASFAWFFLAEPRNVPDTSLGLNGNEQFAYFFAGSGTGLALTLVLASALNWSLGRDRAKDPGQSRVESVDGLEAMRDATYWRVFLRKFQAKPAAPDS